MSISVVVPYFNSKETIYDCINAIYSELEGHEGAEIIIVDDGSCSSNQGLEQYLCTFGDKIKVIHQSNRGVSCARNLGVMESQNEIIMFCDSDDYWLPGKVANQINLLSSHNAAIVGSAWNKKKYPFNWDSADAFPLKANILPICWWPHISTIAIKKNVFIDCGGFDSDMRYAEDGDFLLKLLKRHHQIWVSKSSAMEQHNFRHTHAVEGLSSNKLKMALGELKCIFRYFHLFGLCIPLALIVALKFSFRTFIRP